MPASTSVGPPVTENQSRTHSLSPHVTHGVGVNASDNGISFIAFTDRVMVNTELLSHKVYNPTLLRRQCTGESEFVPHMVILEEEDPRINLERRRVVEVELV